MTDGQLRGTLKSGRQVTTDALGGMVHAITAAHNDVKRFGAGMDKRDWVLAFRLAAEARAALDSLDAEMDRALNAS